MADEAASTTEETTTETESSKDFRSSPAQEAMARQINDLRAQLEAAKKAEADKLEQDALKRGEHEAVIAKLKAEKEAQQAEFERTQLELRLTMALAQTGVTDKLSVAGALALYDGEQSMDEFAAWVAEQRQTGKGSIDPAATAIPAKSGQVNGQKLKQQLNDPDPTVRATAGKAVEAYFVANGQFPPGF